jgi:hypothetical protein
MSLQRKPEQQGRRHFFRAVVAGTALIPLLASQKAAAMGWIPKFPQPGGGDGDNEEGGNNNGAHCLLRGTEIHTDQGPVAIEHLKIGNLVQIQSGAFKPIVGIGRNGRGGSPIRIMASAISPGVPARDLYLSPNHAISIGGNLIPVQYLVNGSTIVRVAMEPGAIEYYHLEFDQHEVMYAEGVAVESLQVAGAETYRAFTEYMAPYAPVLGYAGGWRQIAALGRLAVYPWIDVRDRIQVAYDRLAARAEVLLGSRAA